MTLVLVTLSTAPGTADEAVLRAIAATFVRLPLGVTVRRS